MKQQHTMILASLQQQLSAAKGNLEREHATNQKLSKQLAAFHDERSELRLDFDIVSSTLHQHRITFETHIEQMKDAHHQELSAAKGQHSREIDQIKLQLQQTHDLELTKVQGKLKRQFDTEKSQLQQEFFEAQICIFKYHRRCSRHIGG